MKVFGIISIHVDDLLISGSDVFLEYVSKRMMEKFDVASYGGWGWGGRGGEPIKRPIWA